MLSLTLNHKSEIRNEFLDSIAYRKMVSYMISGLVVDNLNLVIISRFFYVNKMLIKKVGQLFYANKAQHIRVAYVNAFQFKKTLR